MDPLVDKCINEILQRAERPLDKHDIYVLLERKGLVARFKITNSQIKRWLDLNAQRVAQRGSWRSHRYVAQNPKQGQLSKRYPGAGLWLEKTAEPWEDH